MWGWIILIILGVVIFALLGLRNANHNYTIGSGLYKNSDNNLNKDEYLDPSDYNYYNTKDKLK